jgi:hypothetical protein
VARRLSFPKEGDEPCSSLTGASAYSEVRSLSEPSRDADYRKPVLPRLVGGTGGSPGFTELATSSDYNFPADRVNANRQGAVFLTRLRKTPFANRGKTCPTFFNFCTSRHSRILLFPCHRIERGVPPSLPFFIGPPILSDLLFLKRRPTLANPPRAGLAWPRT